jgi:hypothetical protein
LRLISVVEAYVDALSMQRMSGLVDHADVVLGRLLHDFEVNSSGSWQERHDAYERHHGFSLKSRSGWNHIAAGIEVRNSLAHGLGNLTVQQRAKSRLPAQVASIDVAVGAGRMRLGARTIPKLAEACSTFVRDVDSCMP